jgi:hypothetical protein
MKTGTATRWSAFLLAVSLLIGTLVPAGAQSSSETGIIQITVHDAAADQALADARVFLIGPTVASALTTKSGIVKYTDVPSGIYRVRVSKGGYTGVTSAAFEVLGDKQVDVTVDLGVQRAAQTPAPNAAAETGGLKIIGSTRARVNIVTTDVDDSSAVRRISDSLTDALSTIGGVDVTTTTNDPNSPQTISLRGRDESQTAVTLDGIPLSAPGSAADLRKINTDLFAGAGVSFGAQAGALGGSVNFRTLQPTQTWQTKFASSYGTYDKYNYQIGETGSIGKLGIAVLHTKRAGNNALTFQDYLDQSGLDYAHGGESANIGDFVKLRYGLGDNTTLLFTALQNNQATSALCTQWVTPLPCGIGPDNNNSGKFQFMYGTVQSLIGQTAVSVTGYVNNNRSLTNDLNRYITPEGGGTPVLSPFSTQSGTLARGIAASATTTRDKHTFTLSGSTYAGITSFTPLVGGNGFVVPSTFATASRQAQLSDSYKVNDKLTLGPNLSYASTTGAGGSLLGGFSASWRPAGPDTYKASFAFGSSQAGNGLIRTYSDPNSARVNCYAGTAQVSGPGDLPGPQSSLSYDLAWTHQWSHGQFSIDAYRQSQSGQLISAAVTANSLGLVGTPYFNDIAQYFGTVCGANFGPTPTVYVQQQIGGTTRVYQGYTATAQIGIGKNVVLIPSFSTTGAAVTAANPLYTGLDSTLVLNAQIPGRPLHTGNLTVDAYQPQSGLEFLANAHYVGANNNQHIAPYVLVNAGISHAVGLGRLTFFASNLFNTESGTFSTLLYAQPIPLSGGGTLLQAANPNAPRQYTVTYSFNTGARPGAGFSRGARASTTAAGGAGGAQRGGLGFGQLKFVPPPAGTDPLTLDGSRPECTAELRPAVQTALAQLKAVADAYASGAATLPPVKGIDVSAHGDPKGTWWLALAPDLPRDLLQQRPGGPGGGRGPQFAPPGGPRGEGGPPGYQERVAVGPAPGTDEPRPAFSPSPQLIAALQPFRSLVSCSYGTVFTPSEAKARGYDVGAPGFVARVDASPSPAPSPVPGASPAPRGSQRRGGFVNYAPGVGLFVIRAPQLQTGGGSVKQ